MLVPGVRYKTAHATGIMAPDLAIGAGLTKGFGSR